MTDALTSTGLSIDDLATRRADTVADLRAEISSILDVSADQPIGQVTDIILERFQSAMELLQGLHASFNPAEGTGLSLDAVCSITGTYRNAATFGTVTLDVDLNAVTTVPAGSQCAVAGDPDNIWVTDADVTSVGAGNYDVTATALTAGALTAPVGSITVIVTPVAGWNSVTNGPIALPAEATPGEEIETDADLRARRTSELFLGGSTSAESVQAEVSALTWVNQAIVYANDYWRAVAPMPPHSIEAVISTPATLEPAQVRELAELIYTEKASGIQAYGSSIGNTIGAAPFDVALTSFPHVDTQGNTHVISWTRATDSVITIVVTINAAGDTTDEYIGDTALTAAIVAWGTTLGIGDDVVYVQLVATIVNQTGIENITGLTINGIGVDIAVGAREIADISTVNITINS